MWDWYVQTGEIRFNERWAEMLGYTIDELSPVNIETWFKLCHPDDLAMSNRLLRAHFAGRTPYYECEVRLRHKDGPRGCSPRRWAMRQKGWKGRSRNSISRAPPPLCSNSCNRWIRLGRESGRVEMGHGQN